MTHKHSWEFREDGYYCEDCGDKLGDAKEQINRRLVGIDDRFNYTWATNQWSARDQSSPYILGYNSASPPNYCSSDSPRSLLEGIEAQLDKRQFHDFYMALRNLVYPPHALTTGDTSQRGMICATAEQKARAIYAILEKE